LALFFILFWFGFRTVRISGNTFWMQVTILSISTFVGLNPQEPVATQTIIDSFLGLIAGMGIATVVGRLIWPVLPQRLLLDDLLEILSQIKALLGGDAHREKIQTLLAILPVEALQAARQIRMSGCSEDERARLRALVRALQALVTQTTELVYRRHLLPEITAPILQPQFEGLEIEFEQMLDVLAECFRRGDCRREFPSLRGALAAVDQAVEKIAVSRILSNQSLEAPVRTLDLVDRYHATGEALEECGRLARTLEIQRYWGGLRAVIRCVNCGLARLSLLAGVMTREAVPNAHRDQKVCTTGAMLYFCSKSFRRELMRGGGWAGSVSLSCSSRIF
jgi:hypothetical protein